MEVYHINQGGGGYLRIEAEVPNDDLELSTQRYEVNQFSTSFTNDPEIKSFILYNVDPGSNGTFILKIHRFNRMTL